MKKYPILVLSFLFILLLLCGCSATEGDGTPQTKYYETVQGNYDVVIEDLHIRGYQPHFVINRSGTNRVEVQADSNIMDLLDVKVDNDKHEIRISLTEKQNLRPTYFAVTLSCPVKKVELNGNYQIDWSLPEVKNFTATFNGNCEGTILNQDLNKYELTANGTMDVKASGKAEKFTLTMNGKGDFEGYKLETTSSCKVTVNGSGNVEITANGSLYAEINGKGNITYDGDPTATTKYVNGKGKIQSRADAEKNK
ncbi:MAG: DUF2807 domain-containing protein [Clostridia bacterium]|nr:DUF2807 domain-containing protein [Clostridia bacterium]